MNDIITSKSLGLNGSGVAIQAQSVAESAILDSMYKIEEAYANKKNHLEKIKQLEVQLSDAQHYVSDYDEVIDMHQLLMQELFKQVTCPDEFVQEIMNATFGNSNARHLLNVAVFGSMGK